MALKLDENSATFFWVCERSMEFTCWMNHGDAMVRRELDCVALVFGHIVLYVPSEKRIFKSQVIYLDRHMSVDFRLNLKHCVWHVVTAANAWITSSDEGCHQNLN